MVITQRQIVQVPGFRRRGWQLPTAISGRRSGRRDRTVAGAQGGDMAGRAPDLREQLAAPPAVPVDLQRRGNGQKAHERVGEVELGLIDLGIGRRVDARGDRLAADGFLSAHRRVGHTHLGRERAGVELVERRHEALAAEAADPTVSEADRKSTRLNSSHSQISYAVFCLKKNKLYLHCAVQLFMTQY